jgi:hypothetical protein
MELVAALLEEDADPSGSGMLLVHDDGDLVGGYLVGPFGRYARH